MHIGLTLDLFIIPNLSYEYEQRGRSPRRTWIHFQNTRKSFGCTSKIQMKIIGLPQSPFKRSWFATKILLPEYWVCPLQKKIQNPPLYYCSGPKWSSQESPVWGNMRDIRTPVHNPVFKVSIIRKTGHLLLMKGKPRNNFKQWSGGGFPPRNGVSIQSPATNNAMVSVHSFTHH